MTRSKIILKLVLAVACCSLLSACSDTEYERKVQHAKAVSDPWQRFVGLSEGVDPNAWALVLTTETEDKEAWASATYLALQEAIRKGDQRAIDYVSKGKYSRYVSLRELRAEPQVKRGSVDGVSER